MAIEEAMLISSDTERVKGLGYRNIPFENAMLISSDTERSEGYRNTPFSVASGDSLNQEKVPQQEQVAIKALHSLPTSMNLFETTEPGNMPSRPKHLFPDNVNESQASKDFNQEGDDPGRNGLSIPKPKPKRGRPPKKKTNTVSSNDKVSPTKLKRRNVTSNAITKQNVKMQGIWSGENWKGTWRKPGNFSTKYGFEYSPDPSNSVDEEMANQACSICSRKDVVDFLFCDLCNQGFHGECCRLNSFPGEDDEWHCPSCSFLVGIYGRDALPPSRTWVGWFETEKNRKRIRCEDSFSIAFDYSAAARSLREKSATNATKQSIEIRFVATGGNQFGQYLIRGELVAKRKRIMMLAEREYDREVPRSKKLVAKDDDSAWMNLNQSNPTGKETQKFFGIQENQNKPLNNEENFREDTQKKVSNASAIDTVPQVRSRPFSLGGTDYNDLIEASKRLRRKMSGSFEPNSSSRLSVSPKNEINDMMGRLKHKVQTLESRLSVFRGGKKVLVVADLDCYFHVTNPEVPDSFILTLCAHLAGAYSSKIRWVNEVSRAPLDAVLKAHTLSYVSSLLRKTYLDYKNYACLNASLKVSGSVCFAIDNLKSNTSSTLRKQRFVFSSKAQASPTRTQHALCIVRPPGHRVGRNGPMDEKNGDSTSYFNSVAIGVIYARETFRDRVAVVDMSVDPGIGTYTILNHYVSNISSESANEIFYGSVEVSEKLPRSSMPTLVHLKSNVVTIPNTFTSECWRSSFSAVMKSISDFSPTLIIISAGFDALGDENTSCNRSDQLRKSSHGHLCTQDYNWLSQSLLRICPRTVSVLESTSSSQELMLEACKQHVSCLMEYD